MTLFNNLIILLITGFLTLVGNFVGPKINPIEALPGMFILIAIAFVGIVLAKVIPVKIPSVAYIVTIATVLTIPGGPVAEIISAYTAKVNFLALCTPILAYAGIYTGKNIDSLKKTGWKILVLGLFVILGTYVGSAVIAQIILKMLGQI
ncbi:MAG: DUF340 domain-containing protein [Fusobacterium gastrosuis]|uniref:DUF340 domain-containing protein n=1 Tax=Fusobacterium gastrosuis TaxID=1755100 RepID=UPI0025F58E1A|nr:DUF340 domain-containing protein [uncultured Fusobacterium sp.]MDD7391252.1 DUF340 domain-containing protein [Fusobacteriaceae bacterium]MDY4011820.1 DUF340 domain-containing protein [Fusobacterium gastrosuis]MDD7410024.1 DUF340 domain-containing protein [Fusobacteriaceae bacterium]MDY5712384.1 DUF340 domain-containing protein [Fusobacterium gastrosuis]MDY5795846.1 DUF340 domain-containing protein [Fusobacterium gastrosuis]